VKTLLAIIQRIIDLQMFEALRHRNYRLLFLSSIASSIGMHMLVVAQGWLVLELTDSPLSLGMVWAIRFAPALFLGVLAGSVVDKIDPRRLLIFSFLARGICALTLGILITLDLIQLWNILLITFINGAVMVFNLPSQQVFAVDIVSPEGAMNAISINAMGMRVVGIFGGTVAGLIIEFLGMDWPFYIMVISCIVGIIILLQVKGVGRKVITEQPSTWRTYVEGLKLITVNQIVFIVMLMTLICEILGFSYMVVLPVFARDILNVGPVGLGVLNTAISIGGLVGGLTLASLGNYRYKGRLILGIFLSFGIFLILFSQSPWYPTSVLLIAIVGAMAAGMDTMGQTILLLNVSDEQRGRAMGIWMMSIGFGPIGSITIGAVASLLSASLAVTINGTLLIIAFCFLLLFASRLRRV
jgi:MFS family permease